MYTPFQAQYVQRYIQQSGLPRLSNQQLQAVYELDHATWCSYHASTDTVAIELDFAAAGVAVRSDTWDQWVLDIAEPGSEFLDIVRQILGRTVF
jgi:hypothetical protein